MEREITRRQDVLPDRVRIGSEADASGIETPDQLYEELVAAVKKYHPSDDLTQIERAYHIARDAHEGQLRKSGEPYIIHPLKVAIILAELEMDKETIVAGLLHDVVEDTAYTTEQIAEMFGEEVAVLVDGVTKLTQISWDADKVEIQAENLRKMFLAMARDIRVIIIKLADRLHNMRTAQYWSPAKQQEKARETMDIYSPLAHRLGISRIKVELDDLSLRILEPDVYRDLNEQVNNRMEGREAFVEKMVGEIRAQMKEAEIECRVVGRVKHFFSIYKKMVNQQKSLDQIYDLFAVRILVDTVKDCYAALGIIHDMYKPIPGRFKDYIAMPKPNMYQSLHTTVISGDGHPFEIQIRTYEMHRTAEYGIAAHWKYKEGKANEKVSEEEKLSWLRQILEWQQDMSDNQEFMNSIKNDLNLFSENVYCFTPTGDVKSLPAGSTPVDFAYSVHSAVGNHMVGARVNDKLVPIDYQIQNGDRVEIITSQNSKGPSRDWLKTCRSTQAKNKISQWFKSQFKEENITKGKDAVQAYAKARGILLSDLMKPEFMEKVLKKYGFRDWNAILAAVGHGGLTEGQIVNKLREEYEKKHRKEITDEEILRASDGGKEKVSVRRSKNGIVVKGIDDLAVRFSHCCNPVPGDEIVGFVTRGRGISIHRTDCVNIIGLPEYERARLIDAQWQETDASDEGGYSTEIQIYANDRTGMLVDISKVFTERQINISSITSRVSKQGVATITMSFNVPGIAEVQSLSEKLRQVPGVLDVKRTRG